MIIDPIRKSAIFTFAKKYAWLLLAFSTEFAYMALEILASRLLSPYYGSSQDIWTATIAVILLSGALG